MGSPKTKYFPIQNPTSSNTTLQYQIKAMKFNKTYIAQKPSSNIPTMPNIKTVEFSNLHNNNHKYTSPFMNVTMAKIS